MSAIAARIAAIFVFGYALGISSAFSQERCVTRFHLEAGGTTSVTMSVQRSGFCTFHMTIPRSSIGNAGIISTVITVKPKNGLLGKRGVRVFGYKANDGFSGSDHFEVAVRFDRDDGQGEKQTTLSIDVTVY